MAVQEVSVEEFASILSSGSNLRVIDVREEHEYLAGHIPGAVNVPLSAIVDSVDQFRGEGELFIVCQLGGRSGKACEFVAGHGILGTNVAGGTAGWIELGNAVVEGSNPE